MKLAADNTFASRASLRRKPPITLPAEPAFWIGGVSTVYQWLGDSVFPQVTPLDAWNENIAAGPTFVQATVANQPAWSLLAGFKSSAAGTIFDGSNDYMSIAATTGLPTGANAGEMWAIVNQTTPSSVTDPLTILAYGGTTAGTYRAIERRVIGGINRAVVTDGVVEIIASEVDFSEVHYIRAWFDGTTMGMELDGVEVGTAALVPATGTDIATLGIATTATGATWGGEVGGFMIGTGTCDATDVNHNNQFGDWYRNIS